MANSKFKIAVLEHWFGIDKVLFGKNADSVLKEEELDRYLTTKGAFISNLFEIYKKLGHQPSTQYQTVNEMVEYSATQAGEATTRANEILKNSSVSSIVRKEIREMGSTEDLDESQVAHFVVLRRRNAVALDSMMLESALSPDNKKELSDWQGKVLVDAHKTLRDSLIDIALQA